MGLPMAACVARDGLPLTVLHRRAEQDAAAAGFGAAVAPDAAALAAACDVVSVCVRDEAQVDALLLEQGLLAAARPGTVLAIHSTVAPPACRRWAALAARRGLGLVDAPVSGLPTRARAGTLAIFVGGAADDVARCRPGFAAMGEAVTHTGPVGSGQAAKILNNLVSLSTVAAIAEALRLADGLGLPRAAVRAALGSASADSFALRSWDFFEGEWLAGGVEPVLAMVAKDLGLASALDPDAPPLMADAAGRALRRHLLG
jgi:3-hydroxyisobutyrate dehydrogenase-like beta-hydroxyacid dehydrogenase